MTQDQTNNQNQSPNKQNQKASPFLYRGEKVPEDIHWEWIELIRSVQAACAVSNNGFARLTLVVSIHKSKPVLWGVVNVGRINESDIEEPQYALVPLSPSRVANQTMSRETVAALMSLNNSDD